MGLYILWMGFCEYLELVKLGPQLEIISNGVWMEKNMTAESSTMTFFEGEITLYDLYTGFLHQWGIPKMDGLYSKIPI